MKKTQPAYAAHSPAAAHSALRLTPPEQNVLAVYENHSTKLQNAADATVVAVLKLNLPPAAFAVLEEFRKDFDKASDGVGNTPLLQALEHLGDPDTQEILCNTLRRLIGNA